MGKKDQETRDKSWMTLHESIRRNSHRLEKHILARNSEKVKLIIDLNLRKQRISAATYNRCNDILLGLKLGRKSTERKDSQNEQRKMD